MREHLAILQLALFRSLFSFLAQRLICENEAEAVFYDSTHHKVRQYANGP
jgi:hypothetical protein